MASLKGLKRFFDIKRARFGDPIFNLYLEFDPQGMLLKEKHFGKNSLFGKDPNETLMTLLEMYGLACFAARNLLGKENHVTEHGYIFPGIKEELKDRKAVLGIYENLGELNIFLNAVLDDSRYKIRDRTQKAHIHYSNGCGEIDYISLEKQEMPFIKTCFMGDRNFFIPILHSVNNKYRFSRLSKK